MIVQFASVASCIKTRAPCRGGRAACVGGIATYSGGARGSDGGGVEDFTRRGWGAAENQQKIYVPCPWVQPWVWSKPQQSAYSMQDHLEQQAMRNELLESGLALAGTMLETQRKKKASLRNQVSDGCVGAVWRQQSFCAITKNALVYFLLFLLSRQVPGTLIYILYLVFIFENKVR